LEGAELDLTAALKINRKDSVALTTLGIIRAQKGASDQAVKDLKQAITLNKKNIRAYAALADVFEKNKNYDRAIDAYIKTVELAGNNRSILDDVEKKLLELQKMYATELHMEGLEAYKSGKEKQAISIWTQAIKNNPEMVSVYRDRGLTFHKLGDHKKAIEDFTVALKLDPSNPDYYRVRGDAYYKLKQPESALQDYTKGLELNPRDAIAYNNRALVNHERNDYDQAISDYSKAITIDPSNAVFYENRALVYVSAGNAEKALLDYQEALKNAGNDKQRSAIEDKMAKLQTKNEPKAGEKNQ
jgi:tetratricopeptide (TPR) repeat protein